LPLKTRTIVVDHLSSSDSEYGSSKTTENFDLLAGKSLLTYLKKHKLKSSSASFYQLIHDLFSDNLDDARFIRWLSGKLGIRPFTFQIQCDRWRKNSFSETRGRNQLTSTVKQQMFDEWLENSIVTADRRNGRDTVRMRKLLYLQRYENIVDDKLEEHTSKRKINFVQTTRRVITCTVRGLQQKLKEKFRIEVLKPFYLTCATEKEIILCMCKLCLNTRLLFNAVKTDIDDESSSISSFFMSHSTCSKSAKQLATRLLQGKM